MRQIAENYKEDRVRHGLLPYYKYVEECTVLLGQCHSEICDRLAKNAVLCQRLKLKTYVADLAKVGNTSPVHYVVPLMTRKLGTIKMMSTAMSATNVPDLTEQIRLFLDFIDPLYTMGSPFMVDEGGGY